MEAGLWLGIGCRSGLDPAELLRLTAEMLTAQTLSPTALAGLASLDRRAAEPALVALAAALDLPLLSFSAARLEHETPRLRHPSDAVFAATGCHGVAEAAALAAAGPAAELLVPKIVAAGHVTFAVAGARVALVRSRCDADGSEASGGPDRQ
ncbi:cobalamin biosynthesis protein [Magnetospirillum fulvum]|uniref:Precorrin-3B C17-methyltransferase protein n=1 Tax=Magnetospirillum fulvum MGU-K5 TaxID=1316936 RepID=S9S7B7_MAGFU|nr:cobalamin biosynthesis protein [Magnetospirillum fulvum]EPY01782.1 precorrin-3B C17-methyltransferase protein [Magnetospirillum fulvum MGU-K5]